MASRIGVTATLLAISAFGYFSILDLTKRNGWADRLEAFAAEGDVPTLPDTDGLPARTHFTGVAAVDQFLVGSLRVFYPCLTGRLPALPLFALYMAGQLVALHSTVVIEGLRRGNKGTVFFYTAIWGLVYQFMPIGIIAPLYCALYIWLSPIAKQAPGAKKVDMLSMNAAQLYAVLPAMVLGFVVPTLLPGLPVPQRITLDQRQVILIISQFFPIMVSLWQRVAAVAVRTFDLAGDSSTPAEVLKVDAKHVYQQVIYCSQIAHIAVLTFALFLPAAIKNLFGAEDVSSVNLGTVFVPMSVVTPRQVGSMSEGMLALLQYDLYGACAGFFVLVTYMSAMGSGGLEALGTAANLLMRTILLGPGGAVVWAFWDRDKEALEAASKEKMEKKTQ